MIWDEPANFQGGPGSAPVHFWIVPDENEDALAGAGYVGDTWPGELMSALNGGTWGGFALLAPEAVDEWETAWPEGASAAVWLREDDAPAFPVTNAKYLDGWADGRKIVVLLGAGAPPSTLTGAQPQRERPPGPLSRSSEVIGRTDSTAIRLASIDVVERLAKQVEDQSSSPTEQAIARSIIAQMDVLRVHVRGEVLDETQLEIIIDSLRNMATKLVRLVPGGVLVQLGRLILEKLPKIIG